MKKIFWLIIVTCFANVLTHIDDWEAHAVAKYVLKKSEEEFRDYTNTSKDCVKKFYKENHENQTLAFVKRKKEEYSRLNKKVMSVQVAMDLLEKIIDDSDPDTEASQIVHAYQTAERARLDGRPDWFVLTCFIHDLGKVLCLFDEPQWAVVGDTFPVGCAFSDKIVWSQFFKGNIDYRDIKMNTKVGIYNLNCGLNNVHMSWGHDEYLYMVVKDYLPEEASYIIRYHSFYAQHQEDAYEYLMSDYDYKMFKWVKDFNKYDLYMKSSSRPDIEKLKPYYRMLVDKYFPSELSW